jgi:hypothetical protein
MPRAAFTLVEVLVSVALGMLLMGLSWAGLSQARNIIQRTTVRTELHAQAATVRACLAQESADLHPGCALLAEARTDPASGLPQIDLTWMGSVRNNDRYGFTTDAYAGYRSALVWARWRWEGTSAGGLGRLLHGVSSDLRTSEFLPSWGGAEAFSPAIGDSLRFGTFAGPRRSAARPLDDNDFRLLDNYGKTAFATRNRPMTGDGTDLANRLVPVHQRVRSYRLAFVGASGTELNSLTLADCAAGVRHGFDGCWLDARDPATIAARPVLLRISFTLVDGRAGQALADAGDPSVVSQTFGFSLPLGGFTTLQP